MGAHHFSGNADGIADANHLLDTQAHRVLIWHQPCQDAAQALVLLHVYTKGLSRRWQCFEKSSRFALSEIGAQ